MFIEIRASDDRLRGPKALDAAPILTSALKAATDSTADLTRLRTVCDWIQYRQNFRDPVSVRRVEPWAIDTTADDNDEDSWEIAIDLRRAKPEEVYSSIKNALDHPEAEDVCEHVALEDWAP